MPRADMPASPAQELEARRTWTGPFLAGGVLTGELATFAQCGVSIVLASCGPGLRPVVGRGLACHIDADGRTRIVLRRSSNPDILHALESGGRLAVTFTQPTTHRSIQIKSSGCRLAAPSAEDVKRAHDQTAAFRADLKATGYIDTFAAGYTRFAQDDLIVLECEPEEAFVQTPGPLAGSPLR